MDGQLQQLLELQKIDEEIEKIREEQSTIPEDMTGIEDRVTEAESACTQERESLAVLNRRRVSLENDLVLLTEKLKKYQRQLLSAKTNPEYQAFLREIDTTKLSISKNEEDILTLMEEGEQMAADLSRRTAELEKEKESSRQQIESLQGRLDMLKQEHSKKTREREELVTGMGRRLVVKYERIRDGRGGRAVAIIHGEVCSGCHTTLPPQFAVEIRRGDEILICENCGRILVWEERN